MDIKRERYLNKLIEKKENGLIKVITGIRRCGKSYLLFKLFHNYLNSIGVENKYIIEISLDDFPNAMYRNPIELDKYIRSCIKDNNMHYVFIDEIQNVETIENPYIKNGKAMITFVDVLLGLMKIENVDLYVTGSNSKMLSSDILTEFKDRGDEIRVNPLSFSEFCEATDYGSAAWKEYVMYGGMPLAVTKKTHEEKSKYLKELFAKTYITDVIERNNIKNSSEILEDLLNIVSSAIGSLTNPKKLADTFATIKKYAITPITISKYLDYFIDAFLLNKAYRYDIKGKKYINTPLKYYFTDVGLRNARLNFRQQEESHIMENIIYNELLIREFDIDVGIVEYNTKDKNGRSKRIQYEVDFVANKGSQRYYIQSALSIETQEKRIQETNSLNRIDDSFKKIVIVKDDIIPWHDDSGILYIGVQQFLLEEATMNL